VIYIHIYINVRVEEATSSLFALTAYYFNGGRYRSDVFVIVDEVPADWADAYFRLSRLD
jgi:hypothetical protein